jgi:hypothetical protein
MYGQNYPEVNDEEIVPQSVKVLIKNILLFVMQPMHRKTIYMRGVYQCSKRETTL